MAVSDSAYFNQRAETEREHARLAAHPAAAAAHFRLAEAYQLRAALLTTDSPVPCVPS